MKAVLRLDLKKATEEENEDIVCCKDCKYYNVDDESCDHIGGIVAENNYCSDGEREMTLL